MPHSLTLHIIPQSPLPSQFTEGRHLHALFLNLVKTLDPELSALFHSNVGAKAFTNSALQTTKQLSSYMQVNKVIPAGIPCWWRLCLLDDQLFARLTPIWLQLPTLKANWYLGSTDLTLSHIFSTAAAPDPWANSYSYQTLYDTASATQRDITLTFHTPTCFRQGDHDTALPLPRSVFHTPWRRWQEYANVPLAENLLEQIDAYLYPTSFDLKTVGIKGHWGTFVGSLGTIRYRLAPSLTEEQVKQINTLTNYLYFCGTGRKTTMGFGQVARSPSKNSSGLVPAPKSLRSRK